MSSIPSLPSDIAAVFETCSERQKSALLNLRALIFETAAMTDGVGKLTETLKWGQPAYLTDASKSGSTIRIDRVKDSQHQIALYVHCQTSLILQFKDYYGDALTVKGQRAIIFDAGEPLPETMLEHCVSLALTYHLK